MDIDETTNQDVESHVRLEAFDLDMRARAVYRGWAERTTLWSDLVDTTPNQRWSRLAKTDFCGSALARLGEELRELYVAGYSQAELLSAHEYVKELIRHLAGGSPVHSLDQLDLALIAAEAEDHELALLRRIEGETPSALSEEAQANLRESAILVARASELERRAELIESTGRVARARLGNLNADIGRSEGEQRAD